MFSIRAISSVTALLVVVFAIALFGHKHHHLASPSVYEAPLIGADDPRRILGNYYVKLQENHFENHITQIGTRKHVQFRIPGKLRDSYVATEVEDSLLAAIRADPGVLSVEVDRAYSLEEVRDRPLPNPE
jgi:hypothetical protein